ncbi:hypothetical protein N7528_006286 [Penicillium herquei]|nr:hypothetical protein N7528_006286 [Penicillium herquei]
MPKTGDSAESFWLCEGLDDDSAHRAIRCSHMARMAKQARLFELDIIEDWISYKLERDRRVYPKIFSNSQAILPRVFPLEYREYPVFQEGHIEYSGKHRPSGPGPVRVHIPWDYKKGDRVTDGSCEPYQVTYHDPRKGPDHWENVTKARRCSKTKASKMGAGAIDEFRASFKTVFRKCRQALKKHQEEHPWIYGER